MHALSGGGNACLRRARAPCRRCPQEEWGAYDCDAVEDGRAPHCPDSLGKGWSLLSCLYSSMRDLNSCRAGTSNILNGLACLSVLYAVHGGGHAPEVALA